MEVAHGALQPIYGRADLLELAERTETADGVSFLLGIEGLDGCVQDIGAIEWLYAQGVRHVSLTWNGSSPTFQRIQYIRMTVKKHTACRPSFLISCPKFTLFSLSPFQEV